MYKNILLICALVAVMFMAFSEDHKNQVIYTDKAPAPIGPYSQAIRSGGSLYLAGQIALRTDGSMDTSSIENECRQILNNLKAIVEAGGKTMGSVTKVTIYTTDLKQFARINEVYKTFFASNPPARETVEVRALPKGAHLEISAIAH